MKTSACSLRAFTLIELLVVIGIIAILMALLFPAINGAKYVTQKTRAKNDCVHIADACRHFYSDYSVYPTGGAASGNADISYGLPTSSTNQSNAALFDILMARTTGGGNANTRQIVYFSAPEVKDLNNPRNGMMPTTGAGGTGGGTPGALYDPWGTEYMVLLDANYDGAINMKDCKAYTSSSGLSTFNIAGNSSIIGIRAGAAAISFGKDKTLGTNGNGTYSGSDDIVSW